MLPKNLMIVEDEVLTRRFIRSVVEKLGIQVVGSFDNGADLLEALKSKQPEMILMDINIKGSLDGLQTVRHLYKKYSLPIIFITAYTDSETLAEAMELFPYGFVAKPVTPKELEIALYVACATCKKSLNDSSDHITLKEGFIYKKSSSTLYRETTIIRLSKKERQLVALLIKNLGIPIPPSVIETELWPLGSPGSDALASLIKRFRKKTSTHLLTNFYGSGYTLVQP